MKISLMGSLLAGAATVFALATPVWAEDPQQSQDILVTGQQASKDSTAGTKTDTPVVETPQSIAAVPRDVIDARDVQNLNAALELTAGVTPDLRGANAEVFDQFKLRGFDVPQYLDGLRLASGQTGFANPQVDIALIDRIDVLKGPASALYGQASPGGLIVITSRLPLDRPWYGGVAATGGSFDLYRFDADVGGRAGSLLYRAAGSINGADTQQRFGKRRRYVGDLAITIGSGGPTTLTLVGSYSHDPYNGNYGVVPYLGSLAPNPNGPIPRDFADGDPDATRFWRNQGSITYLLDQALGGGWAFHSRGRYVDVNLTNTSPVATGIPIDASLRVFQRISGIVGETLHNGTLDNQVTGGVATGPLRHTLLFGVEALFAQTRTSTGIAFVGVPPIDPYAPVYGLTFPAPPIVTANDAHQRQVGIYAQDQIALGDLKLTASGRYDWVHSHAVASLPPQDSAKDDRRFTWRVGALYALPIGVSPYVSYATSFQPQSAILADGRLADASRGRQFEAGVKYQPSGTTILLSAAWFDIVQSNVISTNPLTLVSTQSGRVTSRGFEIEANVPVLHGLLLTANYGRQRVRDQRDTNPFAVGQPLIGTTRDGAGVFARYTVQGGALAGVGLGGGVRYVGRGYGGYILAPTLAATQVYVPSYTVVDATLSYDLGRTHSRLAGLTAQVNVANVGDERYVSSCNLNGIQWCWYGSRRTVLGMLTYRW